MIVPITAVYAAVVALMMLALAYRVTTFRRRDGIGLGDQGSRDLQVAVRAHANLVEYGPIFVVLLFVGELNGVGPSGLHAAGLLFVLSRCAHAWGMSGGAGGVHPGRILGIVGTWLAILLMIGLMVWNLTQFRF